MKVSLLTSVAAHVIILGLGFFSLSSPIDFNEQMSEPLPVSLVPIEDELAIQKGDMTAPKADISAPKPTQKPEVIDNAEHVGDGNVDTQAPLKPEEKDRDVESTPPPSGEKDGETMVVPPVDVSDLKANEMPQPDDNVKAEEPSQQEQTDDDNHQNAQEILENHDANAATPALESQEADEAHDETATVPEKIVDQEKDSTPILPDIAPLPIKRPDPVAAQPAAKPKGEDSIDDILAMNEQVLVDRTRTSGGGVARSQGPAALGGQRNVHNDQHLAQTFANIVSQCIRSNFDLAALGGGTASNLRIKAGFRLKIDGMLDGQPQLSAIGGDTRQQEIGINQARAAISRCTPFPLPADKYGMWRDIEMILNPFD
ncbi:hypothetical protein [Bartonella tamiae]|uniref:Protein TolA n=1 Tax=Bartonella tamiae Th239 TaxID=1094558 RepID=J0R7M5_9HYPH|nr:hypothetical protein [Bartonella tamiae]EJF91734.1 hypothetical protein ME5_00113 [Bartonella tamiae Th239]EJF92598.1 hypothetical protein MEG_01768 [Bartonella tamiae Th307]